MLRRVDAALPADVFMPPRRSPTGGWPRPRAEDEERRRRSRRRCAWSRTPTFWPRWPRPATGRPAGRRLRRRDARTLIDNARAKLSAQGLRPDCCQRCLCRRGTFGGDDNAVIWSAPTASRLAALTKADVARALAALLARRCWGRAMIEVRFIERLPHARGLPLPRYESEEPPASICWRRSRAGGHSRSRRVGLIPTGWRSTCRGP